MKQDPLDALLTCELSLEEFSESLPFCKDSVPAGFAPDEWYLQMPDEDNMGLLGFLYHKSDRKVFHAIGWYRRDGEIYVTKRPSVLEGISQRYGSMRNAFRMRTDDVPAIIPGETVSGK